MTDENGKYNYAKAVHPYPPFFDISCSAKNYKIASALTITDKILDGVENLAEFPHMGPPHPDPELTVLGYRKLVLTRTYVAVYRVIEDMVYVYRIVNGTTDYPKLLK